MHSNFPPAVSPGQHADIFERVGDALLAVDGEWRCTRVNRAAVRLLRERYGPVPGAIEGQVVWEAVPAIVGTPLEHAMRRAVAQLEPATSLEFDSRFDRWFETRAFPDEDGLTVLVRDVTERAGTRLQDILASVSDLFLSCDREWRLTYANRRAETYLRQIGKQAGAMLGRSIWEELPQLVGTSFHAAALRTAADRVEVEVEDWLRLPGVEQCFVARFAPSAEGVVCYARDVTLRKRAEAAAAESVRRLRESEDRFRLLVESVDDVVFRLDRDQRCVDIFGRWLEREGLRAEMFLGRTTRDIVGPAAAPLHEEANRRALAGERVVYEWEMARPRGIRHIQTSLAPLRNAEGEIIGVVGVDRDMTERFAAEREIQRLNGDLERRVSELQTLLDVLPVGIGIARDPECRNVTVNATYARMLGIAQWTNASQSAPGAERLPFRVLEDGREVPAPELPLERAARSGRPVTGVLQEVVRRDGSRLSMLSHAAPLFDESGRVRGAVGAYLDVTERIRRAAHQRLLAEVGRLLGSAADPEAALAQLARLAIPSLADFAVVDLADDGGLLRRVQVAHADRELEARLAAGPDGEARGPAARGPVAEAFRTGEPVLASGGDLFELAPRSLMAVPLRAHGRTTGVLTFGFSHSGRRHTRDDLALAQDLASRAALALENARLVRAAAAEMRRRTEAESEANRWAFIFRHAAWGVAIVSPDGERLEEVNPAFARAHGFAPEELKGRPVHELFAPHRHAELPAQIALVRTTGHHIWESEHVRKDGSVFPVLMDLAEIRDGEGRLLCYAGTVQDLSERKRADEQLRQAQKMDAIGRLAGGVAHDFNNMLMIILGFSDFLVSALAPDDPRRTDAAEIRKAAERASHLTRQLLSLGHPTILTRQIVDLNAVIRDLDPMLRPLLREDIHVSLSLSASLGGVAADRGQLEQVVMNLALNARDAMPHGGRLSIETINVDLPEGYAYRQIGIDIPAGPYVMLVVSDTGEGMDPAVKARVFEPFFSTKPASRNTGLGLATVYTIVSQAGGYIWVDSEPGQGAAFKLLFPRVELDAAGAQVPSGAPAVGGKECVLLVEDEAAVRSLAGRVLAGLGYVVLEAANGREALRIAREYPGGIHLLVTDVVMPEMGGLELIEQLTAIRPGIGLLVMSGYLEPERLRSSVRAAGVPFLHKPFSPESLARKVRQVLDEVAQRA